MNLGQAKNILIVAFTGLNLILGYYLFWPEVGRFAPDAAFTSEEQRITEAFLNENNYYLQTALDRSSRTGGLLTVEADMSPQYRILETYDNAIAVPARPIQALYYRTEDGVMIVYPSGAIQLIYDPPLPLELEDVNETELTMLAKKLLTEKGVMPEQLKFDRLEETSDGNHVLHYYQVFNGTPLYAGKMKVFIEAYHIEQVELFLLVLLDDEPEKDLVIISAAEAVTSLVEDLGYSERPRQILGVESGYYSEEYDAEKWEIPPVWRVLLDDGELYYVNAFTGTIEKQALVSNHAP